MQHLCEGSSIDHWKSTHKQACIYAAINASTAGSTVGEIDVRDSEYEACLRAHWRSSRSHAVFRALATRKTIHCTTPAVKATDAIKYLQRHAVHYPDVAGDAAHGPFNLPYPYAWGSPTAAGPAAAADDKMARHCREGRLAMCWRRHKIDKATGFFR